MKKILSVMLILCTVACLGVLLVGCSGDDSGGACTAHTWEVVENPGYDTTGLLKCERFVATKTLPTLDRRENYHEGTNGPSSYEVTYIVDGQRFTFEQSFYLYEEVGADTIAVKSIIGCHNAEIRIPSVIDGKTVVKIKSTAFDTARSNQWQLIYVSIPSTVTEVEGNVLSGLNWIQGGNEYTTVEFPLSFTMKDLFGDSVPGTIGAVVFNGGSRISASTLEGGAIYSVGIPASVTEIEADAFKSVTGGYNRSIRVSYSGDIVDWCNIEFGNIYANPKWNWDGSSGFRLLNENGEWYYVNEIVIPDGVTEIKDYAFAGFPVQSIIVPDSVTYLGEKCFASMYQLRTVILGNGITDMGRNPFDSTHNVTNLYFTGTANQLNALRKHSNIVSGDGLLGSISDAKMHVYSETAAIGTWSMGNSIWHYDESGNPVIWDIKKQEYYFGKDLYNYSDVEIVITDEQWTELLAKKDTDEISDMLADWQDIVNALKESETKEEFISKARAIISASREGANIQFGKNGIKDNYKDSRLTKSKDFIAVRVDGVWGAYAYTTYTLYLYEVEEGTIAVVSSGFSFSVNYIYVK